MKGGEEMGYKFIAPIKRKLIEQVSNKGVIEGIPDNTYAITYKDNRIITTLYSTSLSDIPSEYIKVCTQLKLDTIFEPIYHYNDLLITFSDDAKVSMQWDMYPFHYFPYTYKGKRYDMAFEVDWDNMRLYNRMCQWFKVIRVSERDKQEKQKVKNRSNRGSKPKKKERVRLDDQTLRVKLSDDTDVADNTNDIVDTDVKDDTDDIVDTEVNDDTEDNVVKAEIGVIEEITDTIETPIVTLTSYLNDVINSNMGYKTEPTQMNTVSQTVTKSNNQPAPFRRLLGIDIGVKNIAAITSNVFEPVLISGAKMYNVLQNYEKCYNSYSFGRYYHKAKIKTAKKHFDKRNELLENFIIECANTVMSLVFKYNITDVVIGYPKGWSQSSSFKSKTIDKMVQRALCRFKDMVQKRCNRHQIGVKVIDESYTSKCSFIDGETVAQHTKYMGVRTDRDTYITSGGHQVNADVNASMNIIRLFLESKKEWSDIYKYQMLGTLTTSEYYEKGVKTPKVDTPSDVSPVNDYDKYIDMLRIWG